MNYETPADTPMEYIRRLNARIAELEAYVSGLEGKLGRATERLAAVIALCDKSLDGMARPSHGTIATIRAAATGDKD